MIEVLELVIPPPVQISNKPASFIRSSYSPSGNGNTRSIFCRSTQNCASPGLSPVSLPTSYMVTTTTLTGMGVTWDVAAAGAGDDANIAGAQTSALKIANRVITDTGLRIFKQYSIGESQS